MKRPRLALAEPLTPTERAYRMLRATQSARAAADERNIGGVSGPAAALRPFCMDRIEGRARGSVAVERIEVRRYSDATLLDRMHSVGQISDRQHDAGMRMAKLWTSAGLNPRLTATLGASGVSAAFDDDDHAAPSVSEDPDFTPRDRYRQFARGMPDVDLLRLEAAFLGQHPGITHLEALQVALSSLADRYGLEK